MFVAVRGTTSTWFNIVTSRLDCEIISQWVSWMLKQVLLVG